MRPWWKNEHRSYREIWASKTRWITIKSTLLGVLRTFKVLRKEKLNDFSPEISTTKLKLSIEIMMEGINPAVTEKNELENQEKSILLAHPVTFGQSGFLGKEEDRDYSTRKVQGGLLIETLMKIKINIKSTCWKFWTIRSLTKRTKLKFLWSNSSFQAESFRLKCTSKNWTLNFL